MLDLPLDEVGPLDPLDRAPHGAKAKEAADKGLGAEDL